MTVGNSRRSRRAATWLPLVAVVAPMFALASPAAAATATITKPGKGSLFNTTAPIEIAATVQRGTLDSATVNLSVQVPGESTARLVDTARDNDTSLAFTFNPACPAWGCRTAPNGEYRITVSGSSANDSATFTLRAAPAAPAGVDAVASGQHSITVSWRANNEPDFLAYDLFERAGEGFTTVASNLTATSYEVVLPSRGYHGDHTYAVRARRKACPTCSETLSSGMSMSPTVTLTEPGAEPSPTPSPTEDPGGDGGYNGDPGPGTSPGSGPSDGSGGNTGGNTGGNGGNTGGNGGNTGGSTGPNGQPTTDENGYNLGNDNGSAGTGGKSSNPFTFPKATAFGLNFKDFAPKLGAPKLPPLPKTAPVPTPDGTFNPTLPYGEQTIAGETEYEVTAGGAREVIDDIVSTVFEGDRLWRSIAAALVLLLLAGHLRVWLNNGRDLA